MILGMLLTVCAISLLLELTVQQCSNLKGDTYCSTRLATADYCVLDAQVTPCDCAKACKAPTSCNDATNADQDCTCLSFAKYCTHPTYQATYQTKCNTTCQRRDTVACDAVGVNVTGASPLFNNLVPTYSVPRYGDVVTFQCDKGFNQTAGTAKPYRRICTVSGRWELDPAHQTSLVCQRISCGATPAVALATPSRSSGVFEDVVTYNCTAGYNNTVPGNGSRVCNATGFWVRTGDDPVCQVKSCGAAPEVPNAMPSIVSGSYGDVVNYSCITGHKQTGGAVGRRICPESAAWELDSGQSDPVCTGFFIKFVNSRREAQMPPPQSLTSTSARTSLECATFCAQAFRCHGYTFTRASRVCEMNVATYLPVITAMKKKYT